MANIKVSEMPLATSVAPEDLIMLIQGGGNKRVTTNTLLGDNVIVSPTEPVGNDRKKVWFKWSNNLFDKDNTLDGYEINGATGGAQVNSDWFISDYIKVNQNDKIFLSGKSIGNSNCFYDRNKKYINKVNLDSGLITVPNNSSICYLRFNGLLTEKDNIMLEYGTSRTEYQPYVSSDVLIRNDNNIYQLFNKEQNNQDFYSTEETKIGTWIDGKPLYRKTIVDTTFRTDFYFIANNIEQFVNQYGYVQRKDYPNSCQFIGSRAGTNMFIQFLANDIYSGIQIDWGSNWKESYSTLFNKIIITVEYTKTTD